ncbi:MAG: CAP domain-containing protein [Candidatus Saccharibacteria bacterium]
MKTNKSKTLVKSVVKRARHHIKMAVVPHHKNGYRPHLIRGYGLVALAFVVIGIQLGYNVAATGQVLGIQSDITINAVFDQTNQARIEAGFLPLKLNAKLNQAAYLKAEDMFAKQYWDHISPDGVQPWKWFGDVGYNYDEAGENLAKDFTSTDAMVTAWLNSPEHKANLLRESYQDVGFAVVGGDLNGQPTILVVALYGKPATVAVAAAAQPLAPVADGAASNGSLNLLTQFVVALQSITPAVIVGLVLIAAAIIVALLAHAYRRRLPKPIRLSWRRHHGLYKVMVLISFSFVVILVYGGGQI